MTSEMPISWSVEAQSTPSAIKKVYSDILAKLRAYDFSREDIFAVHLALEEAFTNAVRHGNKMDRSKKIMVDCLISSERLEISLTDQGCGFDPAEVPDPRCGDNIYKTTGRGLLLIGSYMDELEFNEKGNQLRMVRNKRPENKPAVNCGKQP